MQMMDTQKLESGTILDKHMEFNILAKVSVYVHMMQSSSVAVVCAGVQLHATPLYLGDQKDDTTLPTCLLPLRMPSSIAYIT